MATPDADPKRVYHNIGVAIDPARQLFNGQPSALATWIDALGLSPGKRVLHIGAGLGYYTAVMAHVRRRLRSRGRPTRSMRRSPAPRAPISRRTRGPIFATATPPGRLDGPFDAMLVNAGVTHPLDSWLDALAPEGKLMLPLTARDAGDGLDARQGPRLPAHEKRGRRFRGARVRLRRRLLGDRRA